MTEEEIMYEVRSYTEDIHKWVSQKDYASALIISRGLTKFIVDIKKQSKAKSAQSGL